MSQAPPTSTALSAGEIAALTGGRLVGAAAVVVTGVGTLREAKADQIALLAERRYASDLDGCEASLLLVAEALADLELQRFPNRVVCPDAHLALTRLLEHWFPPRRPPAGVHPTAVLGSDVRLGADVSIGPYAVIDEGVELGDRVVIGAHACVGAGTRIGEDTVLHPQVVVYPGVEVGKRVILHAGVRLGVDGFGYVLDQGRHRKVPQVGRCVIGDDVEIGANTCLDRGSIGQTVVEDGAKLDNLVHLGHNVSVGSLSLLAAMVGVAGSTSIGKGVAAGGQVGINGHIHVGDGARLAGQAGVVKNVPPGATVSGYPARDHREYLRAMAQLFKLPDLVRRVKALEESAGDPAGQESES